MRIATLVVSFLFIACGGAAVHPEVASSSPPRSVDEALVQRHLTPITLEVVASEQTSEIGGDARVEGDRLIVHQTGGYNASSPRFARRDDGMIVMVNARAHTIVDRHVPGGCLGFAGGRGWFERVEYRLPEGARYGGSVEVEYDDHIEVVDYSSTAEDGSPCPPPAID